MSPQALEFAPRRFSTGQLSEKDRIPYWREMFGHQAVRLRIECRSTGPFQAEAMMRRMPGLRSVSFVSDPAHLVRPMNMVADGDDALVLLIPSRGTLTASQGGREVSLNPGNATLLLHGEPSEVTHARTSFRGFIVPRAPIAALVSKVEDAAMRPVPGTNDALRLLMSYMRGIGNSTVADPCLRNLVTTHVHDLMAVILGPTRDGAAIAEERGVAAARLAAIKADIIENIGGDELALAAIAARHSLTPRTVQRLFEREGASFSAFRLEQQLARAHGMLGEGRYATWTVAAIAGAAGFSDLSYFHRVFRRRFGVTPAGRRATRA